MQPLLSKRSNGVRNCRSPAILLLLLFYLSPTCLNTSSSSSGAADALLISSQRSEEALRKFQAWRENANRKNGGDVRQEVTIQPEALPDDDRECRLSHFAVHVFPDSLQTRNAANLACRSGKLLLNHTKVSGATRVRAGDILTHVNDKSDRRTQVPADPGRAERFCNARLRLVRTFSDEGLSHSPLRVLYEDNWMAIVCKPAGIHTMSWSGSFGKSLCLDEILPLLLEPPTNFECDSVDVMAEDEPLLAPLPRHRLDARVAGPVVVAKTRRALIELGRSFEEKTVIKEYRAIVVGEIQNNCTSFTIHSDVDGRESETQVVVMGQTPCVVNGVLTDLKLFPKTGRKHQLRVHCAEVLGTPILGDDLHCGGRPQEGGTDSNEDGDVRVGIPVRKSQGLFLYCKQVSIRHPLSGELVSAEIPEPFRFTRTRTKALKGFKWAEDEKKRKEII
jgi:23S rRNA-/tRNA-specific pseudouridylate synthase